VLEVADTGVGMDQETLAHAFEPFFTTKDSEHGTGLGLATVYGIVRGSGGFLWAYSELGRGTSFKAYLPLVESAVEAASEETPAAGSPVRQGRTVLLVEDDAAVRVVVRRMLEQQGFTIIEAAEGGDALALSDARAPDTLDVLVTDTIVPGPGGAELAARIQRRHPGIRTLLMSGYADPSGAGEEALGPGTDFLAKPFSGPELQAKLVGLLSDAGE
jgi:CheY-like chemotaxis protein